MYDILFSNQFKRSYKDWLLIWEQRETELILILTDTGTHSDLFG